ncbi:hypothetical protein ACVIW2_006122 [Bradyrhizobium huanghuaihaiense]|uniref:Uncharacterized protein n=1 Tax=Bradyrhizobium huanghuaihaiense TaxID=990078 RepID=A0A562RNK9_9BRAD|nr:hypothetical protein [Bradyrhizobium huanghuaihaiense]TWI70637.1 hypothetical protein IQ16_03810 [Bradyrhizobium huanghuaihaiense]
MAILAELYVRLDPYDATEAEYEQLGEHLHEAAIGTALRTYGGDVTVEVTITEGSAKIKMRVMQTILALDLIYGHMADWKSFKEQVGTTYEATVRFLNTMAEEIPKITQASPKQVKRLDKRDKASGKLKELVDSVDMLRQPMLEGASAKPLLRRIQRLAIEAEKDLTDNERNKLTSLVTEEVPDIDDLPQMTTAKVALLPSTPKLPTPPGGAAVPPKTRRRKSRVVFHKSTQVPRARQLK